MAMCPNSRGCRALGHFFPTRLLKPLNPFIGYESHIQYVIFSVVVTNQQPLSTIQRANKIRGLTIVYGFYFTQCVCMGSIERLTLSLNICIMYSWYSISLQLSTIISFHIIKIIVVYIYIYIYIHTHIYIYIYVYMYIYDTGD